MGIEPKGGACSFPQCYIPCKGCNKHPPATTHLEFCATYLKLASQHKEINHAKGN